MEVGEALLGKIFEYIRDKNDIGAYDDMYYMLMECAKTDIPLMRRYGRAYERRLEAAVPNAGRDEIARYYDIHKNALIMLAPYELDCYMRALEWNRAPREQFYLPRRKVLKQLTDATQALVDDELDEIFYSMPPRVGKTTDLLFTTTWLIGKNSEKSNLYSAYSDVITSAFYNGCLEIIKDPYTYIWGEIFPTAKIAGTNAKDETLNIDRNKRYPSLTCRSLYGTLNGACDCDGVLMADDLIGGIEEAMNKDRLASAWSKVDNNLLPRAKEKAKILWCGTRWSMSDPAGVRMELVQNDDNFKNRRVKIINIPALDSEDHSNFNYAYGVGFSDEFYKMRRASFERNNDLASWYAQYQGEPIERSGALFEPKDMRFYNGILPDESHLVRKVMATDPAWGGNDYVSGPICYVYEDGSAYVHDVVYNNGDKRTTQPLIVEKAKKHCLNAMHFAVNKMTESYKDDIEAMLLKDGFKINITSKADPNDKAKEMRIFDKAPEIRELYFLEDGKRSKEYSLFMQNLFSFKLSGGNKHDDAPDSLALLVSMLNDAPRTATVFSRSSLMQSIYRGGRK